MDIRVSGHQIETGEALRSHVEARLDAVAEKYLARAISAQVTFGKGPYERSFTCDIIIPARQDVVLKASGSAGDAHLAFDQACDKIEKQLRRYKRRLKDRHEQMVHAANAQDAVAGYTVFAAPAEEEEEPADHPPVIAETRVDVPTSTVSDAVMQLDLRNTNALLFRNSNSGRYNMVYRRGDGTIGWVEPQAD